MTGGLRAPSLRTSRGGSLRGASIFVALAVALSACGRPPLEQRCRMVEEGVVAEGWGAFIRTVALARGHGGLLAAWSDASGTFVRPLSYDGAPSGPPRRVARPAHSIDVASTPDGFVLVLLEPGSVFGGGGGAHLRRLDRRGAPASPLRTLGRAGPYSHGIAVAVPSREAVVVWHDGATGDPAVRLATDDGGEAIRLSSPEQNGCCPHLVARGEGALVVWGEYLVAGPEGRVQLQRIDSGGRPEGEATTVATSDVAETRPVLVASEDGLGLGYRARGEERLEQLFYLPLDGTGTPEGEPVRVGRYDGPTRAVLLDVGRHIAAAEVRSWSREWIVAFDRFGRRGERIGAQFHVFFDHVRFTDVDALTVGTRYLLLYGEDHPNQRVWLGQLHCR